MILKIKTWDAVKRRLELKLEMPRKRFAHPSYTHLSQTKQHMWVIHDGYEDSCHSHECYGKTISVSYKLWSGNWIHYYGRNDGYLYCTVCQKRVMVYHYHCAQRMNEPESSARLEGGTF
jgi:hypothetical protein